MSTVIRQEEILLHGVMFQWTKTERLSVKTASQVRLRWVGGAKVWSSTLQEKEVIGQPQELERRQITTKTQFYSPANPLIRQFSSCSSDTETPSSSSSSVESSRSSFATVSVVALERPSSAIMLPIFEVSGSVTCSVVSTLGYMLPNHG